MIVHTLKMCTGDAGPEQSLVLFPFSVMAPLTHVLEINLCDWWLNGPQVWILGGAILWNQWKVLYPWLKDVL